MSKCNNNIFHLLLFITGHSSHNELLDQHQPIANNVQHLPDVTDSENQIIFIGHVYLTYDDYFTDPIESRCIDTFLLEMNIWALNCLIILWKVLDINVWSFRHFSTIIINHGSYLQWQWTLAKGYCKFMCVSFRWVKNKLCNFVVIGQLLYLMNNWMG